MPRGLRRECEAARLLGLGVRIPPGGIDCLFLLSVICCQAQVSATGRSLVQRIPTECGVCDRETSIMRKVCCATRGGGGAMRDWGIFQFRTF